MSLAHVTRTDLPAEPSLAEVGDYFALLKPRVMSLVIFTALAGMALAPHGLHPVIGAIALLAIAVGAGASGALNMWWDADIDVVMARTRARPIPAGRVTPGEARAFGVALSGFSVAVLGLATNWMAAALLAFTIFFYVVIYTMWLKRATPQNIVIGGAAGALPPMIGWAAVTGTVTLESAALFLVIFMWTPPHFWALALVRSDDYERAGVPMLPVVAGNRSTRIHILVYSILLAPIGLLPWALGTGGTAYAVVAALSGVVFVALAWRVFRSRPADEARAAKSLFGYSLLYLFLLFAVLLGQAVLAYFA
jgi:protoheme IX farnesyltransferase